MIASFFTSILLGGLLAGTTPTTKPTDAKPADPKKETKAAASEWISLFNGKNTKGWHSYGKETVGKAWKVIGTTRFSFKTRLENFSKRK